jgi:hypothetical protein
VVAENELADISEASDEMNDMRRKLSEMRQKLGQFMLGGDRSGGQAGTHAALTLSNAITNLSVGCWGTVSELSLLPSANLRKWRQQVHWSTAPLDQIIVKEVGVKALADGTQIEVMMDVVREDVRVHLPKLRACDEQQQALYGRFVDVEWEYAKPTPPAASGGEAGVAAGCAAGGAAELKWWKKVAAMRESGARLSAQWANELASMVAWAAANVEMCRRVNDESLAFMPVPESYIESLPKHAKSLPLGEHLRRVLERTSSPPSELGYVEGVFALLAKDGVADDDKLALSQLLSALERAALVWERKAERRPGGNAKAANARKVIAAVRARQPGLGQTSLERAKLADNRDVGSAVLEAYSRVLESRLVCMRELAEEVIRVGGVACTATAAPPDHRWLAALATDVAALAADEDARDKGAASPARAGGASEPPEAAAARERAAAEAAAHAQVAAAVAEAKAASEAEAARTLSRNWRQRQQSIDAAGRHATAPPPTAPNALPPAFLPRNGVR